MPTTQDSTEAFCCPAQRTVTETVSLHSTIEHVDPGLLGRKARPDTSPPPPTPTGIDYLRLTAETHDQQRRRDRRIGLHARSGHTDAGRGDQIPGEIPGQPSLSEVHAGDEPAQRQVGPQRPTPAST